MTENNLAKISNAKTLTLFALPTMIMMIFESLYSIVDGIFVARFVHIDALSATNIIIPALFFIMGIGIMFGVGGSAIVAKKMGEGRYEEAREDFSLIALALAFVSILNFIIGSVFIDEILSYLGATDILMPYAQDYFKIILIGILAYMGQFLFQSFFVVAGEPKMGLICVVGAGLTNIVLDYVFIVIFDMGISGAAWGTTLSCAIPNIVGLWFFFNKSKPLHFVLPKRHLSIIPQSAVNGSAALVNCVAMGIIAFLLNKTMLSLVGEIGVAAVTIIAGAEYIFNTLFIGYAVGIAPVLSFHYGAGARELVAKLIKISFKTAITLSIATLLFLATFAPDMIRIYSQNNRELYDISVEGIYIFMFKYIFAGLGILIGTLFTAFSKGKIATLLSAVRTFGLIVPILLIFPPLIGIKGVWIAVPAAECLTLILSFVLFYKLIAKKGVLWEKSPA